MRPRRGTYPFQYQRPPRWARPVLNPPRGSAALRELDPRFRHEVTAQRDIIAEELERAGFEVELQSPGAASSPPALRVWGGEDFYALIEVDFSPPHRFVIELQWQCERGNGTLTRDYPAPPFGPRSLARDVVSWVQAAWTGHPVQAPWPGAE